jgi:hypothetical protein
MLQTPLDDVFEFVAFLQKQRCHKKTGSLGDYLTTIILVHCCYTQTADITSAFGVYRRCANAFLAVFPAQRI